MERNALSRRCALGAFAAGAGAVLIGGFGHDPASAAAAADSGGGDAGGAGAQSSPDMRQYGFMVRVNNCVNCGKCVEVCREHNNTPADVPARRRIVAYANARGRETYISVSCMHCEDPACMQVCPAGAISKGEGGVVTVDHDLCIGCKYCYQACPYEVPHYTDAGMDKCDCCREAGVKLGEEPWCVRKCRFSALEFGPIDELLAETNNKAVRLEGATNPALLLR